METREPETAEQHAGERPSGNVCRRQTLEIREIDDGIVPEESRILVGVYVNDFDEGHEIKTAFVDSYNAFKTTFNIDDKEIERHANRIVHNLKTDSSKVLQQVDEDEGFDVKSEDGEFCDRCRKSFSRCVEVKCEDDTHLFCGKCYNLSVERAYEGCIMHNGKNVLLVRKTKNNLKRSRSETEDEKVEEVVIDVMCEKKRRCE